ncbi:MAG: glycosyltransferase family 4 protein [Promethearchaeota archaeon]
MLNYEFPPLGGGAANANYYLLKEFTKKKNISIDLITSSPNKSKVEHFSKNIRVFKLDVHKKDTHYWKMSEIARWTWKAYKLSKKLIRKNNYDICHCWFGWPSGLIGYYFKKKVPYVIALRGSDVPGYSQRLKNLDFFIFKPISKKVWKYAKAVITNSEGLKKLALKTLKRKINVIYNGIDTEEFKSLKNKKIGKKIKLISTGRLIERKGYRYLIKALEGLNDKFELILIGGGNQKQHLKKLAKKLKVNVRFKGELEHKIIAKELKKADVFILPSLNEGMSNSVLEAMACGLPIIVTDVGGTKELVNGNGFIIKKGSSLALRQILFSLIKDKNKIIKMRKKSREIAKKMSWKNVVKRYKETYDKTIRII